LLRNVPAPRATRGVALAFGIGARLEGALIVQDERPAALASSRKRSKAMWMSNRGFDFLENNLFS
jgi:hypothetical protein